MLMVFSSNGGEEWAMEEASDAAAGLNSQQRQTFKMKAWDGTGASGADGGTWTLNMMVSNPLSQTTDGPVKAAVFGEGVFCM